MRFFSKSYIIHLLNQLFIAHISDIVISLSLVVNTTKVFINNLQFPNYVYIKTGKIQLNSPVIFFNYILLMQLNVHIRTLL